MVSRDAVLISLFGKTELDCYSGGHEYALQKMWEQVEEKLVSMGSGETLIIDCWNGYGHERRYLIKKLRDLGAERVVCWYFVTPSHLCGKWFCKKPEMVDKDSSYREFMEGSMRRDHAFYHSQARNISEDGFDWIREIDPQQLTIPGFPIA